MSDHSVTLWLEELAKGKDEAIQALWDRYFTQLQAIARQRLKKHRVPQRVFDDEDVAQSVFVSLCRGAQQGRFPKFNDRDDLWRILVMLTRDKVVNQVRQNMRQKRGGGNVRGDSIFIQRDNELPGFDQFLGAAPDPGFVTALEEQVQTAMSQLRTEDQRRVAWYRMEGYTNDEIAAELGVTTRSVERKLQIIRVQWMKVLGDQGQ